ncbi:hypothetical protein HY969_00755 [Candidatus Kaiserbacteria bacterium]|nr:hypothetical protein [Candidatus Kaiserbacteria bacterium]
MLSFFPELLFLSPFAALLIRVSLSIVFAYSAWSRLKSAGSLLKLFGAVDAVLALLFLAGAFTQLAAIVGIICTVAWLAMPSMRPVPTSTAALALVMALSLLVMGAGPFAYDLPL